MLLCQYGIVMFISQALLSSRFYRYFKKGETKIFALINIILMNGIDSKLHFHIFHSFLPIPSKMALCQITYVFIFPFSTFLCLISLLFRFISIFFLLHYSHFGPFLPSLIPPYRTYIHSSYMCSTIL